MIDLKDVKAQEVYQKADTEEIKRNLFQQIESFLFCLFPAGDIRHGKFYIGDIHGTKGKSLVIELSGGKAGCWHDFNTGEGGDIFTLWGIVNGIGSTRSDFPKIVKSISEYLGVSPNKKKINGHGINGIAKTPMMNGSATPKSDTHTKKAYPVDELGKFTAKWDYHNAEGELIACVYRYDTSEGKEFRPWDVLNKKDKAPEIRPLYRIPEMLDANTIILVEGEKCADALYKAGLTATTAMNGAKAPLHKTDWSPLEGKSVIVWPDNDDAGREYGKNISEYLKGKVAEVVLIESPAGKPNKWDCADAVAEEMNIKDFILEEITKVMKEKNKCWSNEAK